MMTFYTLSLLIAFLFSLYLMFKYIPKNVRFSRNIVFECKKWTLSAFVLSIAGGIQLMFGYSDIVILGFFGSDTEVGTYRAAVQFSILITFGLTVINPILHPQFSKLYTLRDMEKLQKLVSMSSLAIFFLALVPALLFVFFGEFFLNLTFGKDYLMGTLALKILIIGQLINATFGSVGALLNMTGHEKDVMRGMIYSFFVYIILCFTFIPLYGIEGAAIANATSLVFWNVILRHYVQKRLKIESIGLISMFNLK